MLIRHQGRRQRRPLGTLMHCSRTTVDDRSAEGGNDYGMGSGGPAARTMEDRAHRSSLKRLTLWPRAGLRSRKFSNWTLGKGGPAARTGTHSPPRWTTRGDSGGDRGTGLAGLVGHRPPWSSPHRSTSVRGRRGRGATVQRFRQPARGRESPVRGAQGQREPGRERPKNRTQGPITKYLEPGLRG